MASAPPTPSSDENPLVTSRPEQKLRPSPWSTTARTPGWAATYTAAWTMASNIRRSRALCFSGRTRVTVATWASISTRTRSGSTRCSTERRLSRIDVVRLGNPDPAANRITQTNRPRPKDLSVDAEGDRLRRVEVPTVAAEDLERVQVDVARLRVAARDHTATHVSPRAQDRLPNLQDVANPAILLVGGDAIDLDQHPEAARVDARLLGPLGQPLQGGTRDESDRTLSSAVDSSCRPKIGRAHV